MLIVSILASPLTLTAAVQPAPQRFSADLGVVTPARGQVLRITISPSTLPNGAAGTGAVSVRIRWMQYGTEGCSGMPPVCRHMVVSQGASAPETLGPGDALSLDV